MRDRLTQFSIIVGLVLIATSGALADSSLVGFEPGETGYSFGTDYAATLAVSTEQAHSGVQSAKLQLSSGSPSTDFAKINVPYQGLLSETIASCWVYVPSSNTNRNLAPYPYLIVDANKNGIYDYPNDAIVIAWMASTSINDAWFQMTLGPSTKVHVVGNRTGLGATEFSSSHGDVMGTLGDLCNKASAGSERWGGLNVILGRVGAGEWPGAANYTAYVDDVRVESSPADFGDWAAFIIRNSSSTNAPPVINNAFAGGEPAKEFVIAEGGQKAAWGTSAMDGTTLGDVLRLGISRFDDRTRFTAGSGPYVAPYFNVWITDGLGKFAVIANEPSNPDFQPLYSNGYDLTWSEIADKPAKVFEVTDMSWLPNNGVKLTFAQLAGYRIQAPTVAQLTTGWPGLGTGAPRELGTNKAYGFNWVFGETLSNYVSGNQGYVVAGPVAFAPSNYVISPPMLATGKPEFSTPHGTGSNPFGYDWDGFAPTAAVGAPTGYGKSSFYANVNNADSNPNNRYRTLRIGTTALFGRSVKVGEIAGISYWTKKPADQTAMDWRLAVYTTAGDFASDPNEQAAGPGDGAKWYRSRLQAQPQQASNLNAPAGQWNQWFTGAASNQLSFYESTGARNVSGLSWANIIGGSTAWDYRAEEVMMIDLGVGTASTSSFMTGESQLDGIRIQLTSGEVANVDLAEPEVVTNQLHMQISGAIASQHSSAQVGDWMQVGPIGPNGSFDWGIFTDYRAGSGLPQVTNDLAKFGWAMSGTVVSINGTTITWSGTYWILAPGYGFATEAQYLEKGTYTMTADFSPDWATASVSGLLMAEAGTRQPAGWPAAVDWSPGNPGLLSGTFSSSTNTLTASVSSALLVDDDGMAAYGDCNSTEAAYSTISSALDAAVGGETVLVCPGTYDEPLNIEGKSGLSVIGQSAASTIVKSSTVLPWNVGGYTTQRQTMVRIVNSVGVMLKNLTLDCDLIKGNNRFGITGYDSSVSLDHCVVQNNSMLDSLGYYYELGAYFRAPGFTNTSRAALNVSNCTFTDLGRVGLVTHDYIHATITNSVFGKTSNDFGYGIELGSQSTGEITGNAFYGFGTPALSDGSESAGIYIENCFTGAVTSPLAKNVLLQNNNIYGCQYGLWIGNGFDGYAGNVDIAVTLKNNSIHDNTAGGAWIQDEDKTAGSSVTVTGSGNSWQNNSTYGMRISTAGDGDITVNLAREIISGQNTGIFVENTAGSGSSSYNVSIAESSIKNNTGYGINNTVAATTVMAENNWWGAANGPLHPTLNPSGTGNKVSDYVDFAPYMTADPGINVLKLDVLGNPVYLQRNDTVGIDMNVSNLSTHVVGCQAVLNFSSAFFGTGLSDVSVAAGGGVWDQLIWNVWNAGGDLDVAVGVELTSAVGTKEDGTVAKFTLKVKPDAPDGITQMTFRADGDDNNSTYFSDLNAQRLNPGSKIESQTIVIDNTPPSIACSNMTVGTDAGACEATVTLTPPSVTDSPAGLASLVHNHPSAVFPKGDTVVTWTATDKAGNVSTCTQTVTVTDTERPTITCPANRVVNTDPGQPYATGVTLGTPFTADNCGVASVTNNAPAQFPKGDTSVTWTVTDTAGLTATCVQTVTVNDLELPVLSITRAVQGTRELLGVGAPNALQGSVVITVTASDNCPLTATPTVTVSGMTVTPLGGSAGTFTYSVTVEAGTANGPHTINASVADDAGNVGNAAPVSFNVNKNQVTGQVQLEAFEGTSRAVTFFAKGGTPTVWTLTLSFSGGVANFTLTDVPTGTTSISAKTAWSLREKLTISVDGNGQAGGVNFLADSTAGWNDATDHYLRGGDVNGTNSINILDYGVLKTNWFTHNAVADVDGDGSVGTSDYTLMKANWFQAGDLE